MTSGSHYQLDPSLMKVLKFLQKHPGVRQRLPAPRDKTIVYSGNVSHVNDVFQAWKLLQQAKAQDPVRFDYITLEERLRAFHVVDFGESLFEHANRISEELTKKNLADQAVILWRALSGIYVQGAMGKVRALVFPGKNIGRAVFALTEVNVLLRPSVLKNIDLNESMLREFRSTVRAAGQPAPIIVF